MRLLVFWNCVVDEPYWNQCLMLQYRVHGVFVLAVSLRSGFECTYLQCLRSVHDAGLLVFDLKPETFVWDAAARRVLLVDLNSCVPGPQRSSAVMTEGWSAPEVLNAPWIGDARSDVYSLGKVFMSKAVRWFCLSIVCGVTCF